MRAASLSLGLGMCLVAVACAGSTPKALVGSTTGDQAVASREADLSATGSVDAGAAAAGAPTVGAAAVAEPPPPVVDPALAQALIARSGEGSVRAPLGLRFEVIELGAGLPWGLAVVNRGTEAALVDFDARLLTLEIQLPTPEPKVDARGKPAKPAKAPKPIVCRLPSDVVPGSVDAALLIKLEPGEGIVQNFDPRLYCVGKTPWPLVRGAEVRARFGWAPKMKVTWHTGKREERPGLQGEPFVAEPSEAEGSLPNAEASSEDERRVKELLGTPLTLGADFGEGSGPAPHDVGRPAGLELTISGSDAVNEGAITATTTFTNHDRRKQDLYFRRELVTYEVSGPDGVFHCDPQPDKRAPTERSAMLTLAPGRKFSAVSRLIEMCPAHAFARPGLYLVHARFDAVDSGADLGFKGFMGRLVSEKPALVRVREGELPFQPQSGAVRVRVGE